LAITFYSLLFLAEAYMICINVLFCTPKWNYSWIRQKDENFPNRPPL